MHCRIAINGLDRIGCRGFQRILTKHPRVRGVDFAGKTARHVTVESDLQAFKTAGRSRLKVKTDLSHGPLASTAFRDTPPPAITASRGSSSTVASSKSGHGTTLSGTTREMRYSGLLIDGAASLARRQAQQNRGCPACIGRRDRRRRTVE